MSEPALGDEYKIESDNGHSSHRDEERLEAVRADIRDIAGEIVSQRFYLMSGTKLTQYADHDS